MRKKFKKVCNYYALPTPKKWRKIGDTSLAISTFLVGFTLMEDWSKWIAIVALITGVAGKFLTNFFAVEDKTDNHEPNS
jgi:hypothetical protein